MKHLIPAILFGLVLAGCGPRNSRNGITPAPLVFPDDMNGYATVQNYEQNRDEQLIVKTTDGGKTFTPAPIARVANKFAFVATEKRLTVYAIGTDVQRLELNWEDKIMTGDDS